MKWYIIEIVLRQNSGIWMKTGFLLKNGFAGMICFAFQKLSSSELLIKYLDGSFVDLMKFDDS